MDLAAYRLLRGASSGTHSLVSCCPLRVCGIWRHAHCRETRLALFSIPGQLCREASAQVQLWVSLKRKHSPEQRSVHSYWVTCDSNLSQRVHLLLQLKTQRMALSEPNCLAEMSLSFMSCFYCTWLQYSVIWCSSRLTCSGCPPPLPTWQYSATPGFTFLLSNTNC